MGAPTEILAGVLVWISVDEHMPDDDQTVLVYAPKSSEPVWLAYHDGDIWRYIDGTEAHEVTHWLPMPEGPK